jgi:hypothetical protein
VLPVFDWVGLPGLTAWGWVLQPSPGYIGQVRLEARVLQLKPAPTAGAIHYVFHQNMSIQCSNCFVDLRVIHVHCGAGLNQTKQRMTGAGGGSVQYAFAAGCWLQCI